MATLAVALELMDRVRGEAERAASERDDYAALFERAADAYLVTDSRAVIRWANRAAGDLLARAARFLPGKPLAVFFPLAERADFRRRLSGLGVSASWDCASFAVSVRRSPAGLCWVLR